MTYRMKYNECTLVNAGEFEYVIVLMEERRWESDNNRALIFTRNEHKHGQRVVIDDYSNPQILTAFRRRQN